MRSGRRRVLMTADTVGGVWVYSLELARALDAFGWDICIATMGALMSPRQREEACSVPNIEVQESRFKLEWMQDPWEDVARAGDWLLRLERGWKADVVHLNGYSHAALPFHAPVLVVAHSCVLSWCEGVWEGYTPDCFDRYREEVTRGVQAADVVLAPTRTMLDAVERHYGSVRDGRVIPNGRRDDLFEPRAKEEFVFSAGRLWDQAKNVSALDHVAPSLEWPIYVAGDQKHPDDTCSMETPSVRCLGSLSPREIAEWLGRASIYALPARYEPFGLSVLEAALCGCALVLGDIASLREVWEDSALYVSPNDFDGLRDTVQRLVQNPDLRHEYAMRARLHSRHYSPARMAARYAEVYEELVDRKPATTDRRPQTTERKFRRRPSSAVYGPRSRRGATPCE